MMIYKIIPALIPAAFFLGILMLPLRSLTGTLREKAGTFAGRTLTAAKDTAPVQAVRRFRAANRRNKLKDELSAALAYVKNIAILGRAESISAEMLFEELSEVTKLLSPVFLEMARCMSLNDRDKAAEALYKAIGGSCAKETGIFLAGWEDVPPAALVQSVEVYRSALEEERFTRIKRRDEAISDLVYFPVVLNCAAVLLNFLYVAYFLEQKELLGLFF